MGAFDLLEAVQPEEGWYAVVGIKDNSTTQRLVDNREEFDEWVEHFSRQKYNVFFGVAKYKDDSSRSKHNVQALKAFWLDLDCGPGKSYATQNEGFEALREFVNTTGLPRPIVVNSGRGLHVYWPLTEAVGRGEWEPVASKLKDVCQSQGLHADNACFEAARILRVPGTYNYKGDTPLPVEVVRPGKPISCDRFRDLIGAKKSAVPLVEAQRKSALGALIQSSVETSFAKIIKRGDKGCAQLAACIEESATLTEPRWFAALSIAKFCKDRKRGVAAVSEGHPDYDPDKVEQKLRHIVGPHSCDQFEKHNPGGCAKCPHKNKIKSPIILGRNVIEVKEEENVIEVWNGEMQPLRYRVPPYPFPYARGVKGGVWRKGDGEESEDVLIYPYDLYAVKRTDDPNEGIGVQIRFHPPHDAVREFTISNSKVMDPAEVRGALASRGVVCPKKNFDTLVDYIIRSAMELQSNWKAEIMRTQFGWADGDSKFIIGDREVSVEGTYFSPPSSVTKVLTDFTVSSGSFEKWKEVFNLYGRPGLEAHAFAAATAFGAPLLKFSGQRGAIINVIHPNSGTGKTTILHMANSVWGDPARLCAKKDDTFNSKVFKLGVLCNLPVCFDEMTNTRSEHLSELAYLITQGSGKDRMKASSNELRFNSTTWQTIALCSSNSSFYEKLGTLKNSPQGEMMRIIEFYLDYTTAIDVEYGKQMFDHQLLENYGFAGELYARHLLTEYEEIKNLYATIQSTIDRQLKLTQRERFWSATAAANITGIYIAVRLGLCNWNIGRIFRWTCKMISELRNTTAPPVEGEAQTIGEFIMGRIDNILIVNDHVDRRSKMQEVPMLEPKRDLMIRYEPDTAKVYITATAFRNYCTARSISYHETLKKMKASGMFIKSILKRMTKGMKINVPPVQALMFDATHPDFMSLAEFANPKSEGAEEEAAEE